MKIPMAFVADEANVSQEGKLNALGVFDRIIGASFPMIHPRMVFVFRVEARYGDGGKRVPVHVRLMNDDGDSIFEVGGEIMAPDVAPGDFATAHQVFALNGIEFRSPGMYKFVVRLGDLPPHETPLAVVQGPWTGGGN